MTKSRQCASFPRPGRLCRILLLLAMVKLCVLGSLLLDPVTNFFSPAFSFVEKKLEVTFLGKEAPAPVRIVNSVSTADAAVPAPAEQTQAALSLGPAQAMAAENAPAAAPATDQQSNSLARESLARREQELARREQDLLNLQREIDDRLEQLQVLEQRITVMLKDAQEVKDEKFRKLVDMLSNMKAKQAASVLETLEEGIAVKVLAGMRGRQSGEILTFVNPGKAARLSEALTRMQLPLE